MKFSKSVKIELTPLQKREYYYQSLAIESIYNLYLRTFINNFPNPPISNNVFNKYLNGLGNKRIPSSSSNHKTVALNNASSANRNMILYNAYNNCRKIPKDIDVSTFIKALSNFYDHENKPFPFLYFDKKEIKLIDQYTITLSPAFKNIKLIEPITENSLINLKDIDNIKSGRIYRKSNDDYQLTLIINDESVNTTIDEILSNPTSRIGYILFGVGKYACSIYANFSFNIPQTTILKTQYDSDINCLFIENPLNDNEIQQLYYKNKELINIIKTAKFENANIINISNIILNNKSEIRDYINQYNLELLKFLQLINFDLVIIPNYKANKLINCKSPGISANDFRIKWFLTNTFQNITTFQLCCKNNSLPYIINNINIHDLYFLMYTNDSNIIKEFFQKINLTNHF